MIAIDTNILVYAHMPGTAEHKPAAAALESLLVSPAKWALPWPCVHEFIGTVTRTSHFNPASTLDESIAFIESVLAAQNAQLLSESVGYFEKLASLARAARIVGPRIHDARIAALCLHHGVTELWTADRDFALFPQLKIRNPLSK